MKAANHRRDTLRFWGLGAVAMLLSAGAAFSYLHSMGYGIAAGDLIGLGGRQADVAFAQRWATVWLITAVSCLGVSSLAGALAAPIYEDAAWVSRLTARPFTALLESFVLAVLVGFISFSMITSSHHSIVRAGGPGF